MVLRHVLTRIVPAIMNGRIENLKVKSDTCGKGGPPARSGRHRVHEPPGCEDVWVFHRGRGSLRRRGGQLHDLDLADRDRAAGVVLLEGEVALGPIPVVVEELEEDRAVDLDR